MRIRVYAGDIVRQAVDAIVNAANSGLKLGGGIDNAIRTAAGPDIEQALAQHSWVSEGTAILTPGFRLPAKWVIHTVAPRWQAGANRPEKMELFRRCHRASLESANRAGAASMAFPCIGTGAFGWPPEVAADAAFEAIRDWIDDGNGAPERLSFVCPNPAFAATYQQLCSEWVGEHLEGGTV